MTDEDCPELGVVRIASPCSQKWTRMVGDARARHCAKCELTVFDFSQLSSEEARQLLRKQAGGERICARIYLRADETVMTRDCPVGFRWAKARSAVGFAAGVPLGAVAALTVLVWIVGVLGDNLRRLRAQTGQVAVTAPRSRPAASP